MKTSFLTKSSTVNNTTLYLTEDFITLAPSTITGQIGEDKAVSTTSGGGYIWVALNTSPFKILKVNPDDDTYTVINGQIGENNCNSLVYIDGYLWAALDDYIIKVDTSDNSYIKLGIANCYFDTMRFDGTYVWIGLYTSPFELVRINPVDNSFSTVITGQSGEELSHAMVIEGDHVWLGLDTYPFKIIKFNTINNTYTVITGKNSEDSCLSLTYGGGYIWAGLLEGVFGPDGYSNYNLLQIDPGTGNYSANINTTHISSEGNVQGMSPYSMTYGNGYVWAGMSFLGEMIKINPKDGSYEINISVSDDLVNALTLYNSYVWQGIFSSPFKLIKKYIITAPIDGGTKIGDTEHILPVVIVPLYGDPFYQTIFSRSYEIEDVGNIESINFYFNVHFSYNGDGSIRLDVSKDGEINWITIAEDSFNVLVKTDGRFANPGIWFLSVDPGNNKLQFRIQALANSGTVDITLYDDTQIELVYQKSIAF